MPNCTKTYHTISQTTILNAFTKSDISTQPLTPPKKHVNIFENQKLNATPQTPKEKYISSILFFHQDLCTVWDTEQPENSNLTNPLLMHYPWPKQIQKDSKDPKLILILTMKQVYRYFWLVLPIGKLFWSPSFGPSKLMTFQQHNLLKSQVWFRCESQSDLWCSWSPLDLVNFRSRHVLLHDAGTEFSVQSLLKTTQSKLRFSGTIFPHFTLGVSHTRTHTHTHTHTHTPWTQQVKRSLRPRKHRIGASQTGLLNSTLYTAWFGLCHSCQADVMCLQGWGVHTGIHTNVPSHPHHSQLSQIGLNPGLCSVTLWNFQYFCIEPWHCFQKQDHLKPADKLLTLQCAGTWCAILFCAWGRKWGLRAYLSPDKSVGSVPHKSQGTWPHICCPSRGVPGSQPTTLSADIVLAWGICTVWRSMADNDKCNVGSVPSNHSEKCSFLFWTFLQVLFSIDTTVPQLNFFRCMSWKFHQL